MDSNNEEYAAMLNGHVSVGEPAPQQTEEQPVAETPVSETPAESPKEEPKAEPVSQAFDFSKYGLESEEQLAERLKGFELYEKQVKDLEAKLAEPKDYQWRSPQEKALAEFLSTYNGDLEEGFATHIRLQKLDVDNMNGKDALKENFILSKLTNPNMTREKAEKLFNGKYGELYKKAYGDELDEIEPDDVLQIELEEEEYNAKQALKQKQQSIKEAAEKAQKETEPSQPELAPEIKYAMQREITALPEVLKEMENLTFKVDEDPANDFNAALEKGELEIIQAELAQILNNPAYYEANGKVKDEFSAKNVASRLAYALAGERMVKAALAHGKAQRQIQALKEIEASGKDRGNGYQGGGHALSERDAMLNATVRG